MANPFENIPTVFLTQAQYETLVAGTGTVNVTDLKGNKIIRIRKVPLPKQGDLPV